MTYEEVAVNSNDASANINIHGGSFGPNIRKRANMDNSNAVFLNVNDDMHSNSFSFSDGITKHAEWILTCNHAITYYLPPKTMF